jgi:hypothetical protein
MFLINSQIESKNKVTCHHNDKISLTYVAERDVTDRVMIYIINISLHNCNHCTINDT